MNRRLLQIAFRQEHRKYALRLSLVLHVVSMLIFSIFFIKTHVGELEDEIHVDLLPQLPTQEIPKKKVAPKIEVETPVPEKVETPIPEVEKPIEIKHRTIEKKSVKAIAVKPSVEIAKMEVSARPDSVQQTDPVKKTDVKEHLTALEAPDVSTDAELPPVPESVLSPIGAEAGMTTEKTAARRSDTLVRTPGKRNRTGIADNKTATTTEPKNGIGKATASSGDGTHDTFQSIIKGLADDIIGRSGGGPIDVVFIVDASGSMGDNINAVAEHLAAMIDAYKAAEIDYQLGLTHFYMDANQQNTIEVFQLTRRLSEYKRHLYAIIPTGDENALDAIDETLRELRLRNNTTKHFILVTDEPFTTQRGLTVDHAINACRRQEIFVNVLGLNTAEHQRLATETGGTWHEIPQDPIPQNRQTAQRTQTPLTIGEKIRRDAANLPIDIIFFIDGSKSMSNDMTYLKDTMDQWIRDWDNALINYRLGAVRFYASSNINRVNVFKLPQTQQQIHAILQLPPADDENLLHAIVEATRRIKIRENAKTYFIVFTDEPGDPKYPITGTITLLKEMPVVVCVIGTNDPFQQQVAQQTGGIWVAIPNANKKQQPYQ